MSTEKDGPVIKNLAVLQVVGKMHPIKGVFLWKQQRLLLF